MASSCAFSKSWKVYGDESYIENWNFISNLSSLLKLPHSDTFMYYPLYTPPYIWPGFAVVYLLSVNTIGSLSELSAIIANTAGIQ